MEIWLQGVKFHGVMMMKEYGNFIDVSNHAKQRGAAVDELLPPHIHYLTSPNPEP
jgi:hypothetical protein